MAIPKYNELYPNVLNVLSDGKEALSKTCVIFFFFIV